MARTVALLSLVLLLIARPATGQTVSAEVIPGAERPLRHTPSILPRQPIRGPEAPAPSLPTGAGVTPREAPTLDQTRQQLNESTGAAEQQGSVTQAASASATPEKVVSRDVIAARIKAAQDDASLEEKDKSELLKRLKAAEDWLRNDEEALAKLAQFEAEAKRSPDALAAAKAKMALPAAESQERVPTDASLTQVESLAKEVATAAETASANLAKIEEQIKRRTDRMLEIGRVNEETMQRLDEAEKLLAVRPPVEEDEQLAEARTLELNARVHAMRNLLRLYKAESARNEAESDLLPIQRELAKREKSLAEKRVVFWEKVVNNVRKRESEQQALEARRQLENAHPALRQIAERNASMAEQRNLLVDKISQNGQRLKSVNQQVKQLEEQFEKATERVEKAGHSTTVGLMLRRQHEELPHPRECQQRMREIEEAMPSANLALIEIEEEREALGDIEAIVPQLLRDLERSTSNSDATLLKETLHKLLSTKVELLDSLAADYRTYLSELSELEVSNNKLAEQITKSSNYIGEHVLWIRSTGPIGVDDVKKAARGAISLAEPEPWLSMAKHCGIDMLQRPLVAVGVLIVVVSIVVFRSRLRAKIALLCTTKSGSLGLHFRPTLEAVGLASIVSTVWPLLIAYLGWQLSSADPNQDLSVAIGRSLLYGSCLLWISQFAIQLLGKDGIAEAHFSWPSSSTQLLKRELRWLTALGLPLAIVVFGCDVYQGGEWADSLGRFAFVGAMLVLTNFVHSILNARENVLREAILNDSKGCWFLRLRKVSYLFGVGVPCVLAALAAAGYYYSAQQVAWRWQGTLVIALVVLLAYSIAARWCAVQRRNLAVEQARERQRLAAESADASNPEAPVVATPIEDQQLDLSAIHEQLRYLLRHAATLTMIVATWFVWSDFLPALRVLDRVVLWEKMVEVTEVYESPDGKPERIVTEQPVATTLRHALFAALVVIAAFAMVRYLPALLEITLLQRLPFDAGGRHAISVLFKYSLALGGIFLACKSLSITWSSVQWLAAGMTVGLGFGLQEIFANFVSGLILLFERPIRVGDVITLGDITGTVTNMRIRATTVTNWDRKELIVPNKDLVTGRLLNWTLTDTTNRIVITVGVAYRSDPEVARELVLDAVASHSNVVDDPAPSVTFEAFGDSALNLVARAFLSSMENRLSTINDLHAKIHKTLGEADIEIAFPQRDIHVHGLEKLALANGGSGLREAA